MSRQRILDAVWWTCRELAQREEQLASASWTIENLMREAAGCILASQVPHAMAVAAFACLAEQRLLPPTADAGFGALVASALRSPLSVAYPRAYRFPQQAANRLARLSYVADQVVDFVLNDGDIGRARRGLTTLRCGLGVKQASLLLRTVRAGAEIAVIDVHLLAFMRVVGLTTATSVPPVLAKYEDLEDRFRTYSHGLRVPMHRLDAAAWIVMRAARSERNIAWPS